MVGRREVLDVWLFSTGADEVRPESYASQTHGQQQHEHMPLRT
jgi:hypothetical protein